MASHTTRAMRNLNSCFCECASGDASKSSTSFLDRLGVPRRPVRTLLRGSRVKGLSKLEGSRAVSRISPNQGAKSSALILQIPVAAGEPQNQPVLAIESLSSLQGLKGFARVLRFVAGVKLRNQGDDKCWKCSAGCARSSGKEMQGPGMHGACCTESIHDASISMVHWC